MLFKRKDYKDGWHDGYNKAIKDVLDILNRHDFDAGDITKFSLKCFTDIRGLDKNDTVGRSTT